MIHFKKRMLLVSAFMPFLLSACQVENDISEAMLASEFNLTAPSSDSLKKGVLVPDSAFENYSGHKGPAVLNEENTLKFVDLLYPTVAFDNRAYTQTSTSTSGELSGVLKHQKAILSTALAQTNSKPDSRKDSGIYDFKHCLYKGTAQHHTENLYKLSNCQQFQKLSLDGQITITDQAVSFTDLAINDDGKTYRYSGNLSTYLSNNEHVIEANMHRIDSSTKQQQYFKDLVWTNGKKDRLEGHVYDGENGFIELRSSDDLVLDDDGIPTLGKIHLDGKEYGEAFLSKPSNNYFGSIHIEIDEEGDGFNEFKISKNVIYKTTSTVYAAR